jgi:hypothetical protein
MGETKKRRSCPAVGRDISAVIAAFEKASANRRR